MRMRSRIELALLGLSIAVTALPVLAASLCLGRRLARRRRRRQASFLETIGRIGGAAMLLRFR